MKSLLVLIDGLGDEPIAAWQGLTPFEKARHPYMDALAAGGTAGAVSICGNDIVPESCSCILRLLGVDKLDMPHNRAYLELLANDRDISEYEMVLRCNLAAVRDDGTLAAFNGQGLTPAQMGSYVAACNNILKDIEFIHLSEYRNLLIMNREEPVLGCSVAPPHESVGENIGALLEPLRRQSLSISYFLDEAKKRLAPFSGDGLHYELYPWGVSDRQTLPSFSSLHGLKGGAVCRAEIVRGIARALGMATAVPEGATGDVDTCVPAKAEAALALLQNCDFVLAHFNGSDEAAHRYDYGQKAAFIEMIDRDFLRPVMEKYQKPLRILICGDHVTSSVTGRHGDGPVPVVAGVLNGSFPAADINSYHDIINFLMRE